MTRQEPEDEAGELLGDWNKKEIAPRIVGVTADYQTFDPRDVLAQMIAEYDRLKAKQQSAAQNAITFEQSPVCLVFVADAHLGNAGVNARRLFDEAKTVIETPGMYLVTAGDMIDNMILPKLMHARFVGEVEPAKEWALLKLYLDYVAPKLVCSVGGNHEAWTNILTGVSFFLETVQRIKPQVLYDNADVRFNLCVGSAAFPIRVRHKWRFTSKYNATHGIEDMSRFDADFMVGVGAHTHASGLVRTFNNHGHAGLAVLCGTYKDLDDYAHVSGFAKPNQSTAIAVIFRDNGTMTGYDNLNEAAEIMRLYHNKESRMK